MMIQLKFGRGTLDDLLEQKVGRKLYDAVSSIPRAHGSIEVQNAAPEDAQCVPRFRRNVG
jgi:hypothetical protein